MQLACQRASPSSSACCLFDALLVGEKENGSFPPAAKQVGEEGRPSPTILRLCEKAEPLAPPSLLALTSAHIARRLEDSFPLEQLQRLPVELKQLLFDSLAAKRLLTRSLLFSKDSSLFVPASPASSFLRHVALSSSSFSQLDCVFDADINQLVSHCPNLISLSLEDCPSLHRPLIHSSSLLFLRIAHSSHSSHSYHSSHSSHSSNSSHASHASHSSHSLFHPSIAAPSLQSLALSLSDAKLLRKMTLEASRHCPRLESLTLEHRQTQAQLQARRRAARFGLSLSPPPPIVDSFFHFPCLQHLHIIREGALITPLGSILETHQRTLRRLCVTECDRHGNLRDLCSYLESRGERDRALQEEKEKQKEQEQMQLQRKEDEAEEKEWQKRERRKAWQKSQRKKKEAMARRSIRGSKESTPKETKEVDEEVEKAEEEEEEVQNEKSGTERENELMIEELDLTGTALPPATDSLCRFIRLCPRLKQLVLRGWSQAQVEQLRALLQDDHNGIQLLF
ncbi:Transcriptional regulatory protein sir2b [Balamuthia mandrillaris]